MFLKLNAIFKLFHHIPLQHVLYTIHLMPDSLRCLQLIFNAQLVTPKCFFCLRFREYKLILKQVYISLYFKLFENGSYELACFAP